MLCPYIIGNTSLALGIELMTQDILLDQIDWRLSNSQKAILLNIFKLHNLKNINDLLLFCVNGQINKSFKHYCNEHKFFGKKQKQEIYKCLNFYFPTEMEHFNDDFKIKQLYTYA